MTLRATRVLTLAVVGALTLGAAAAWACDKSAKSASATSCSAKGASMSAKACSAHGSCTAAKKATATAAKNASVTAPKKAAPSTAGMRVYRDPETGTFAAEPAGKATEGLPSVEKGSVTLQEVPLANGGYFVDLQGTGEDFVTLQIDAQGRRVMTCSPDPRTTLKTRKSAAATLAHPEK
jgi:hypothetical protein